MCESRATGKLPIIFILSILNMTFEGGDPDDWFRQALQFSDDKWYHNHGAQGGLGSDGMYYHWYDGVTGCQPDLTFLRQSGLNAEMAVRSCLLLVVYTLFMVVFINHNIYAIILESSNGQSSAVLDIHGQRICKP
jgi:hypothetical protein